MTQADSLRIATRLSAYYIRNIVTPQEIMTVLNRERIHFVLVGAYGVAGWMGKPRATEDVDVVVADRQVKKATRTLLAAFPNLEAHDEEVVVRLRDRKSGEVLVDLMKPRSLYRETFKHTHAVSEGELDYRIPSLEMALAMKFAAMISPNRPDDAKFQDAHDFTRMVKHNLEIDTDMLHRLGEFVYTGGGDEICTKVRQVRAGERLTL